MPVKCEAVIQLRIRAGLVNGTDVGESERVAPRALCAELYVRDRRQTGESLSCLSGGSMAER